MAQITLNIPDEYISRLLTAIIWFYPIPQIVNPEYEAEPSEPSLYDYDTPQYINEYSSVAWAKLKIRDYLLNTLERYETKMAQQSATNALEFPTDLVS